MTQLFKGAKNSHWKSAPGHSVTQADAAPTQGSLAMLQLTADLSVIHMVPVLWTCRMQELWNLGRLLLRRLGGQAVGP